MGQSKKERKIKTAAHILHFGPTALVLGYVVIGTVWLAATDTLAHSLFTNGTGYVTAQFVKGFIYISTTALLVHWLARRAYKSIELELQHERLEMSDSLLNAVLGSIGEAVLLVDPSGRTIVNCNDAAERIFGYEKEELKGQKTEVLHIDRDHFEKFGEKSEAILERGEVFRTEYRMKRKDGSIFFTANTVSPTQKELGWKAGVVSIVRDITEQKEAEEKIQESLREKEIMLQEIHHRVKNNLNVITSLLNLQSGNIPGVDQCSQQAREAIRHSQDRVRSMALVHEQLYNSKDFTHVNMHHFVENMVHHIVYKNRKNGPDTQSVQALDQSPDLNRGPLDPACDPEVHFFYELEDTFLNVNYAIPCSLILNELITNSLSHAFVGRASGEVHIGLKKQENRKYEHETHGRNSNSYVLTVQDNGNGLPPVAGSKDMSLDSVEGLLSIQPGGLGFQIVGALLKQVNGSLSVKSHTQEGTSISVEFEYETLH